MWLEYVIGEEGCGAGLLNANKPFRIGFVEEMPPSKEGVAAVCRSLILSNVKGGEQSLSSVASAFVNRLFPYSFIPLINSKRSSPSFPALLLISRPAWNPLCHTIQIKFLPSACGMEVSSNFLLQFYF